MTTNSFRAAIERGASPEEFAALFASDVTFYTPILEKTIRGRDLVMRMLSTAARVVDNLHYTQERGDAQCTILLWNGVFDGYTLQAATVLVNNAAGLIRHLAVVMRPWPVVALFRDAAQRLPLPFLTPDYWTLPERPS